MREVERLILQIGASALLAHLAAYARSQRAKSVADDRDDYLDKFAADLDGVRERYEARYEGCEEPHEEQSC